MTQQGISITVPAYNEEKYLPATLTSINDARKFFEASLNRPTEVIVVNNASTDLTKQVATEFGAIVIDHPIRNISSVRNAGIRAATHNLIVTIDADCFLPKDSLVQIWNFMKDETHLGGALGVRVITDKRSVKIIAAILQALAVQNSGIYGGMFFFLKDSALAIGGFREDRLIAEDAAFAIDMRAHGKLSGKKFGRLKSVQVGTLDRKDSGLGTLISLIGQIFKAFSGVKQKPEDLPFWYDPKR